MSCRKVYQASEVNKLFLMRFEASTVKATIWVGGCGWELWWMDLCKMCTV